MRRDTSEALADVTRRRLEQLTALRGQQPESERAADLGDREEQRAPSPWDGTRRHADAGLADRLQARHLGLVAAVAVVAIAVAWWMHARAEVRPVPVSATPVSAAPGSAGPLSPNAVATTSPAAATAVGPVARVVVVDVAGKVRRPGVATLPVGSRVIDAIEYAGGARSGVDLTAINLARLLVDGEQILVTGRPARASTRVAPGRSPGGAPDRPGPGAGSATQGTVVNINTADATALETLPGVGPATARKILAWRTRHGRFTSIDELLEIDGIGPKTLARIAPGVTL